MRGAGSYELVLSAMIFALGGWFVDGWFGTRPLFTCLGVVFGFTGACVSIYYRYKASYAESVRARLDAAARSGGPVGEVRR